MIKYIGERRQIIVHLYKYHIALDQVPNYCTQCHFWQQTGQTDSACKGVFKTCGAAKAFKKSIVHKKKLVLRTNRNLAHLTEGVNYIRLSRREYTGCRSIQAGHLYLFDWGKVSFVTSGFNPQDSHNCTYIQSRITRNGFAFKDQHFQRPIH